VNDESNAPVRIVVKKKGHRGGHHGGAWKVAYADFVTAMMALFIVLWIVGQSNGVKQAIAAYFKDPGVFSSGTSTGGIHQGASLPVPKPEPGTVTSVQMEMEKLRSEGKKIEQLIASNPAFEKFKDKVEISVTKEGMRIELIENSEGLFFDVGSAKVKGETVQLLTKISDEVGKMANNVIVEGHTDARPYVTPGYSNWELSADRANATRKLLEEHGLRKDQVREVRGYADRHLRSPDKPTDFSNRRVSILVAIPQKGTATIDSSQQAPRQEKR
jgi:chemotaxis protein MotB